MFIIEQIDELSRFVPVLASHCRLEFGRRMLSVHEEPMLRPFDSQWERLLGSKRVASECLEVTRHVSCRGPLFSHTEAHSFAGVPLRTPHITRNHQPEGCGVDAHY
jgi:hypothetical protein